MPPVANPEWLLLAERDGISVKLALGPGRPIVLSFPARAVILRIMDQVHEDFAEPDPNLQPGPALPPIKLTLLLGMVASLIGVAGWMLYQIAMVYY